MYTDGADTIAMQESGVLSARSARASVVAVASVYFFLC